MLKDIYKEKLRDQLEELQANIAAALDADFAADDGHYNYNYAPIRRGFVDALQTIAEYRVANTHDL